MKWIVLAVIIVLVVAVIALLAVLFYKKLDRLEKSISSRYEDITSASD